MFGFFSFAFLFAFESISKKSLKGTLIKRYQHLEEPKNLSRKVKAIPKDVFILLGEMP